MLFASARNLSAAASMASARAFSFETSRDVAMRKPDRPARSGSGATTTSHHLRTPFIVGQAAVKRAMRPRRASLSASRTTGRASSGQNSTHGLPSSAAKESASKRASPGSFTKRMHPSISINLTQSTHVASKQSPSDAIAEETSSRLNSIVVRSDNLLPSWQFQTRLGTRANRRHRPTREIAAGRPFATLRPSTGQAAASRFVEALRSKNSA